MRKIPLLFPLPRLDPLETQTSSEVTKKKRWRGPTLGPAIAKHKARKPLKPFKIENELQDLEPGKQFLLHNFKRKSPHSQESLKNFQN